LNVTPREPGPKVNVRRRFWRSASDEGTGEATGGTGLASGGTGVASGGIGVATGGVAAKKLLRRRDGAGAAVEAAWEALTLVRIASRRSEASFEFSLRRSSSASE
jgi:hypothetical protein